VPQLFPQFILVSDIPARKEAQTAAYRNDYYLLGNYCGTRKVSALNLMPQTFLKADRPLLVGQVLVISHFHLVD
jgi:hypothetical protein